MRTTALVAASVVLFAGCGGGTAAVQTIEDDLAALTLLMNPSDAEPIELADGSTWILVTRAIKLPPNTVEAAETNIIAKRLRARGTPAIPELMRLAKATPRMTYVALGVISSILLHHHREPFRIHRTGGDRDYWVIRWPTGEGLGVVLPEDVAREREQALEAFETWLKEHSYLPKDAP